MNMPALEAHVDDYKISSDIAPPRMEKLRGRRPSRLNKALSSLEVKQSVFVKNATTNSTYPKSMFRISNVVREVEKKLGVVLICETRLEQGVKGLRVWRVE